MGFCYALANLIYFFMRNNIANPDMRLLKYQIREIMDVAQKLGELDPSFKFVGENIGDPIVKSWTVPPFLKEEMIAEISKPGDAVFGYSHSRGWPATRKWVVEYAKRYSPSSTLNYEYVVFSNGLGAAIGLLYQMLPAGARILQPAPSYPTHTSLESFAAKADPVMYQLDPENDWQPDLADMEAKIKSNPKITGILLINPNNPTGTVYSAETLEKIIKLAEQYKLMIISDEVYFRMVYNGAKYVQITELAQGRIPLIVLRGISKDLPWPGSRCGWVEFHNVELDPDYKAYADGVRQRILLEVCSTTLPQVILPRVYDNPGFAAWLEHNNKELEANGNYITEVLNNTKGLRVNRPDGAFYMMPLFKDGVLNDKQTLPIANEAARKYIEEQVSKPGFALDKRFTYYLLAATGICVVPASGFYCPHPGFRLTTLERDPSKRKDTYGRLSKAVEDYLAST